MYAIKGNLGEHSIQNTYIGYIGYSKNYVSLTSPLLEDKSFDEKLSILESELDATIKAKYQDFWAILPYGKILQIVRSKEYVTLFIKDSFNREPRVGETITYRNKTYTIKQINTDVNFTTNDTINIIVSETISIKKNYKEFNKYKEAKIKHLRSCIEELQDQPVEEIIVKETADKTYIGTLFDDFISIFKRRQ